MKIVIETIPHDQHRYPTIGDWWWNKDGQTLEIRVSEFSRGVFPLEPCGAYELLIALHELIEAVLCDVRRIAEADVTAFDKAHLDLDEPGEDRRAPYHKEHVFAECIERLVALELGVNWQDYEVACLALDG